MGSKLHLRRDDLVVAIAGDDAGAKRTGKVLQVLPRRGRAVVEGFHFVKKTVRKSQDLPNGDIIRREASVAVSNLQLYCPNCKQGVRVARGRDEKGQPVRKCRKCGHEF
ncbi:MAG: 50S ribosomal protein L24 [Kiritimatiellia bacterium]|jgi:large subunit ribosomal protein L24